MPTKKQPAIIEEGFNAFQTIKHLSTADLIIHTIPGEEWTLSMYRHKTLLVDVYVLSGTIAGAKRASHWECGRLCELLIKLLRTGRNASYRLHNHEDEDGVEILNVKRQNYADTLEEDALQRLRGGDILFNEIIPNEIWRLSATCFGRMTFYDATPMFYLAEAHTLGTPDLRMFKSGSLEHVLLQFLCQQSEFVEHAVSNVVEFKRGEH